MDILLVEDSELDAELARRSLNRCQLANRIYVVSDGERAISFLSSDSARIGLVLLDLHMPKMDGFEVLRTIRSNLLLTNLPVVILRGSEDRASLSKARALGANSYIEKPIDFPKLVQVARTIGLHWQLLDPRLSRVAPVHRWA
jgi:two-component system response regulator